MASYLCTSCTSGNCPKRSLSPPFMYSHLKGTTSCRLPQKFGKYCTILVSTRVPSSQNILTPQSGVRTDRFASFLLLFLWFISDSTLSLFFCASRLRIHPASSSAHPMLSATRRRMLAVVSQLITDQYTWPTDKVHFHLNSQRRFSLMFNS